MHVAAVGSAFPPHFYDQETLIRAFEVAWGATHHNTARVRRMHQAVLVGGRHLALPLQDYLTLTGFGARNDAFIRVALDVAEEAVNDALTQAGLTVTDVDAIFSASVTGIATPSIDARLFHRMGLRPDIVRTPIFGLGCVAGAAGLARLNDWLLGHPDGVAVLLCVELCSLTIQREDFSVANLVASGLFGDGGAAVVCVGKDRAARMGLGGPTVVATRSRMYPDSERVMGWDIGDDGFKVILDKSVPDVVTTYMRDDVDGFLAENGLTRADIGSWVCHPGGPKVLDAFESTLEIPKSALDLTWRSLQREGNMSSASVLFVLRDTLAQARPEPGTWGMMLAMGPGFCSELVLLRW